MFIPPLFLPMKLDDGQNTRKIFKVELVAQSWYLSAFPVETTQVRAVWGRAFAEGYHGHMVHIEFSDWTSLANSDKVFTRGGGE